MQIVPWARPRLRLARGHFRKSLFGTRAMYPAMSRFWKTPGYGAGPGKGQSRTGRLWNYVRDDHPFAGPDPTAVFFYTPDVATRVRSNIWGAMPD